MSIRGNIASRFNGGPEYRVVPDRLLVEVEGDSSLTDLVDAATLETPSRLQNSPVGELEFERVEAALDNLGSTAKRLNNLGVLVVEIPQMESFIENTIRNSHIFNNSISRLQSVLERARGESPDTIIGGFGPGRLNFGADMPDMEAALRNELMDMSLSNPLTDVLEGMDGILNVEMSRTMATFGPQNLNIDPLDRERVILGEDDDEVDDDELTDLGDVTSKLDLEQVWEIDSGSNAVCAIFDTSFCEDAFDSNRVLDTFSGDDVESAFSDPEEGHGTMCAYAAAGNESDYKFDYSGIAKDADLLLVRVSDSSGALSLMAEAWDWLIGRIKTIDRPVISNHSYGMPVCSARGMNTCGGLVTKMARLANQRSDHQAFYAAGNEAVYCGHRLSGVTNGINGINSDTTSLTSAALRFDLRDAQTYSSHGYGTCTNVTQNPKPDFGFLLPQVLPYGCDETNMATNFGGSGGGTSAASPMNAGLATIIASITGTAERSVIENIMEGTAEIPRTTQVNSFRGHDARFGNGQSTPLAAVEQADIITVSPTAGFTVSDLVLETGDEVVFDASVTQTGDSTIETYNWDLGNGDTARGRRITQTYAEPGDLDVTLTVTDDRGDTDSATRSISVIGQPQAVIDVPARTFRPDEVIAFDGSNSLNAVAYDWDFGDGTIGTGQRNSYSYDDEGDYTVTLQVENDVGSVDVTETTVRIDYPDPQANIVADSTKILTTESVTLDGSGSQNSQSYTWSPESGETRTGESITYSYDTPGEYTVSLEVQNAFGEVDTDEIEIDVSQPEPEDMDGSESENGSGDESANGNGDNGEETPSRSGPLGLIDLGFL